MLDPVCSLDRDTSALLSHALTGHKTQHFHFTLRCYVWEMLIHSVPETELELICSSLLACVRGRMQCGGRGDLGASAFCTFPQTQAQGTQARAAVPLDSSGSGSRRGSQVTEESKGTAALAWVPCACV